MAVLWGVTPVALPRRSSTDEMIDTADRILLERGLAARGDRVAMAAGVPPNQDLATNLLKLHVVGEVARGIGPALGGGRRGLSPPPSSRRPYQTCT